MSRSKSKKKSKSNDFILTTKGHATEFGWDNRSLRIFGSLPKAGVGPETGILVVALGYANPPENPYYLKLRRALADLFNVICVGVEILGTCAQRTRELRLGLFNPKSFQQQIPKLATPDQIARSMIDGQIHLRLLLNQLHGKDLSSMFFLKKPCRMAAPMIILITGWCKPWMCLPVFMR